MAFVRVEQRNAHLASVVKLDFVNGRDGPVAKGTVTAISNVRRQTGEGREEEATSIQWTLWGKLAENAAEYLGRGSHVNIVGRVRNNNYRDAEGRDVYGLSFTCESTTSTAAPRPRRGRHGMRAVHPLKRRSPRLRRHRPAHGRARPRSPARLHRPATTTSRSR